MAYEYKSVLAPFINDLIAEKRIIGFKYESAEKGLKKLDLFFLEQDIKNPTLTREIVEAFITKSPNETLNNRSKRIADIRELARFMNSHGFSAYVYPALPNRSYMSSFVPYIFTNEELAAFFKAVDNDKSDSATKYSIIFRLLYSTGMRVGEVLSLTYGDIDFEQGTFFIRQGKKNKDRMIPVDKGMLNILLKYIHQNRKGICNEDRVFVSPRHDSLKHNAVYEAFRKYLWKAGVLKMRNWVLEGRSLDALYPYICAYMGHSDTRSTEYYTRLTADLFPDIRSKCEAYLSYRSEGVQDNG